MGGFVSVLGKIAKKAGPEIENAFETHAAPLLDEAVAKFSPMKDTMEKTNAGKRMYKTFQEFFVEKDANKTILTEAAKTKTPPIIGGRMQPLHNDPAAIDSLATKLARDKHFGAKDERAQLYLAAIKKEAGLEHARHVADHFQVAMKDAGYSTPGGPHTKAIVENSRLVRNIAEHGRKNPESFSVSRGAPYEKPGEWESKTKKGFNTILASGAVLPHAATVPLNMLLTGPLSKDARSLFDIVKPSDYKSAKNFLITHGKISELSTLEYKQNFEYQQSKLKKLSDKFQFIPGSITAFIHRNYSMPGLNSVRQFGSVWAGMRTKLVLEELSAQIITQPPGGSAEKELIHFGLNPNKIRTQGGNLTPEDWITGLHKGIDEVMFHDNPMLRSEFGQTTTVGRMMNIYHYAITRQKNLIGAALKDAIASRDAGKIARVLGTLAIIAPEIGIHLRWLEQIRRGYSIHSANKEYSHSQQELNPFTTDGPLEEFGSYIEAMTQIGGAGIWNGAVHNAARRQYARTLIGPYLNTFLVNPWEDIQNFMLMDSKHPDAWKPIARDAIDLIPFVGGAISHHALPTKQEESEDKPKTARGIKQAQTREAKKKPSNNILKRMFN